MQEPNIGNFDFWGLSFSYPSLMIIAVFINHEQPVHKKKKT